MHRRKRASSLMTPPRRPKPHTRQTLVPSRRSPAQGLVEFSLIIPILMLLIVGAIEFGRLMFIISAVTTASREAARYGFSSGENGF